MTREAIFSYRTRMAQTDILAEEMHWFRVIKIPSGTHKGPNEKIEVMKFK